MENGRYIKAGDLVQELLDRGSYSVLIKRAIEAVPSADVVEVVHGKWQDHPADDYTDCSVCGFIPDDGLGRYCPSCGARMDGKDNVE